MNKDAVPFILLEMQKKSLRQRRRDNEDVEGFSALMAMLKHDMVVMRVQAFVRGMIGRRHRLAMMILDKKQKRLATKMFSNILSSEATDDEPKE